MAAWEVVVRALRHVRPYIDVEELDRAGVIAVEADLDAAGLARLMATITAECGVAVPPCERPATATFDALCRYLAERLATT